MSHRWVRGEDASSQEPTPETSSPVVVKDASPMDSPKGRRILKAQKQGGPNRLTEISSAKQRADERRLLSLNPADTPGLCCQFANEIVDDLLQRTKLNPSRNFFSSSICRTGPPSLDRFARSVP